MIFLFSLLGCSADKVNDTAEEQSIEPAQEPAQEVEEEFLPESQPATEEECTLSLTDTDVHVPSWTNYRFELVGGSGNHTYTITSNQSGGMIHPTTGAYIAGGAENTVDTIVLDDPDCQGQSVEATVSVWTPFMVAPDNALIPPGTSMSIYTEGGSGQVSCSIITDQSQAQLDGCDYTAGETTGDDIILVQDLNTLESEEVLIRVDLDASISLPVTHWAIPVESPLDLPIEGGSGFYDLTLVSGDANVSETEVTLLSESIAHIDIQDRYADLSMSIQIDPLPKRSPSSLTIFGGDPKEGKILRVGDVTGDGLADAIVTDPDADYAVYHAGAAYVFADNNGSFEVVQVLSGETQNEGFGVGATTGDFNDDGMLDLRVSGAQAA